MSGYFALKLETRFWTVSSLPQPPMGYVHSLMLAPAEAVLEAAAEEAVEDAAVLEEEEPPHEGATRDTVFHNEILLAYHMFAAYRVEPLLLPLL